MKIAFVEMAGFRGVRDHVRLDFPDGFVVLTGRNGSGKSTICDAIEFGLTGSVSKHYDRNERGETFNDYLWWRGGGASETKQFVSIGLRTDEGNILAIRRTPTGNEYFSEGHDLKSEEGLIDLLCDASYGSRDNLGQLCRTSIVRDETLAAESVDLAETERFTFVKAALGSDNSEFLDRNQKSLIKALNQRAKICEAEYQRARDEVASVTTALSEARASAGQAQDLAGATEAIRIALSAPELPVTELQSLARKRVAEGRRRIEQIVKLGGSVTELLRRREKAQSHDAVASWESLSTARDQLRQQLSEAKDLLREAAAASALMQPIEEVRSDLSKLHYLGEKIGLRDDACPLCRTELNLADFAAALRRLADEVEESEKEAVQLQARVASLRAEVDTLTPKLLEVERALALAEEEIRSLDESIRQAVEEARRLGVYVESGLSVSAFETASRAEANALHDLEAPLSVLDISFALDRVTLLSRRATEAQAASEAAEQRLREAQRTEQKAKDLYAGIRRAIGEVVDERLAALAPLLKELYTRLRPHVDWQDVHYHLRGDVRRHLSLRVGDDMNPRFVFSSGQRRAAGLAFLLAVHLSRPWCKLKTLVLDDPIQHVDDFRALHLAEVLGSISRGGRQIICTVEDPALAELLSRRLGTREDVEGVTYKLGYAPGRGVQIEKEVRLQSSQDRVLALAA